MSNLPPGITDSMLEPDDPACGSCGHACSDHLEDNEIVYDSNGDVILACDHIGCQCEGFYDGEYEPERDWWDD